MKRTPLRRRSGVRRVNPRRAKERRENALIYGPYHRWISTLPCHFASDECVGRVTGHHVKTVATGGEDYGNEVPLCAQHHTAAHHASIPRSELESIAAAYAARQDAPDRGRDDGR